MDIALEGMVQHEDDEEEQRDLDRQRADDRRLEVGALDAEEEGKATVRIDPPTSATQMIPGRPSRLASSRSRRSVVTVSNWRSDSSYCAGLIAVTSSGWV